jgi:RimJ/RimL family protein N-acetyltransferase
LDRYYGVSFPVEAAMTITCDSVSAKAIIEAALVRKLWEPFRGLIVQRGMGETIGAIVFNNYDQRDVHFTCVLSAPIGIKDARYVARYVFKQLGCARCTAVTGEFNIAAQRALLQLGFKFEGRLREHFEEGDGLVYGILRSEQKIARL